MPNHNSFLEARTSQSDPEHEPPDFMLRASQVWLLFGVLEILISLRIALKMVGANPDNTIVALLYGITSLLLIPFMGLIGSATVGSTVLEISSMFAMLIYALVARAIVRVVWLVFYRPPGHIVGVTETTASEHQTSPSTTPQAGENG